MRDLYAWPHVGWIPTVNGRLSFRHIGDTRHPTESIYANLDYVDGRIIVAYQRRPLSDILFPRLIHRFYNISGDFWFVLTGRTDDSALKADRVTGRIHIYKSKEDWRRRADREIRAEISDINALRFGTGIDRVALATLAFDRAQKVAAETADVEIEFELDRDGEVSFGQPRFREAALEKASVSFAEDGGHDLRKWVADQSYFFLRDAAHSQQHHEPYSDTILMLQTRDAEDIEWRKKVIYSLHYAIIRFKRDADVRSALRAIGILAYCNSFKECSEARFAAVEKQPKFERFNEGPLLQSLHAKADEISVAEQDALNRQNAHFARASVWRSIAVAFAAVIIALVAIFVQPRISKDEQASFPVLYKVSTFAAENFLSIIGIVGIILLVTWVATHSAWATGSNTGRSILEASYIRRWKALAFFIAAAGASTVVTLVYSWPAVKDVVETLIDFARLLTS